MFGYIKPFKPNMRISEFETYKAVYCTLCKSLGKNYGIISRLTLSYDCTFLAFFDLALNDKCVKFRSGRCVVNPLKRCNYCDHNNKSFVFAGAVCVILTYYKILDDIRDSKCLKKLFCLILRMIFYFPYKRAKSKFSQIDSIVSKMMEEQMLAERCEFVSIDRSAHPTAQMLSSVFALLSEDKKIQAVLKQFGYFMGRWVYLIDASDDITKDLKKGNFNPFIRNTSSIEGLPLNEYCNQVLNNTLSQAISAYDLLPIHRFKEILDNTINLGLPNIQKQILFDKNEVKKDV